ncbi:MAG: phosphoribosyltransferase [Acidobacteriota bacterium]|nr:phosphoribosyltransferase [Acidobacteriota bacterium]
MVCILRDTGALRDGHFVYSNGLHSNEYLQVALAMRYYQHAKTFSVGLSRLLRANSEIRAAIPELSIVAPATGGLPVAYGVCEALQAKRVYWAEKGQGGDALRFRQFIEPQPGEQVVIVDDLLRSGSRATELKALLESYGAVVMALAVVIYQPNPRTADFGALPLVHLTRLEASYYTDGSSCVMCRNAQSFEKVWV